MQKQLLLFHNAVSAYFSGNNTMLEATMKQFSIKVYILYLSIYLSDPNIDIIQIKITTKLSVFMFIS